MYTSVTSDASIESDPSLPQQCRETAPNPAGRHADAPRDSGLGRLARSLRAAGSTDGAACVAQTRCCWLFFA